LGGNPPHKTQDFWGNPKVQKIIWELPGRMFQPRFTQYFCGNSIPTPFLGEMPLGVPILLFIYNGNPFPLG